MSGVKAAHPVGFDERYAIGGRAPDQPLSKDDLRFALFRIRHQRLDRVRRGLRVYFRIWPRSALQHAPLNSSD